MIRRQRFKRDRKKRKKEQRQKISQKNKMTGKG